MKKQFLLSARVLTLCLALLGLAYPLFVYVIGRVIFPFQAAGSLLSEGDRVIGSESIGQEFSRPLYFAPRPSAAGYDAGASRGSNLGPTSAKLFEEYRSRVNSLKADNPARAGLIPLELVAASASGLDPDISPGAALWQVPRVAGARRISRSELVKLIEDSARPPLLGFVGEWRVNVLKLNRRLDEMTLRRGRQQKNE
jgi:K+-transporting ATPase ATPase C chain